MFARFVGYLKCLFKEQIVNRFFPHYGIMEAPEAVFPYSEADGEFADFHDTFIAKYIVRKDLYQFQIEDSLDSDTVTTLRHLDSNITLTLSDPLFDYFFSKYVKDSFYHVRFDLGRFLLDGHHTRRTVNALGQVENIVYYKVVQEDTDKVFIFNEQVFNLLFKKSTGYNKG